MNTVQPSDDVATKKHFLGRTSTKDLSKIESSLPWFVIPLLLILGLFLTVFISVQQTTREASENVEAYLSSSVHGQANLLVSNINIHISVLKAFADSLATQESFDQEDIVRRVTAVAETSGFFHIFFVNKEGNAIGYDNTEVDVSQRTYAQQALQGKTAIEKVESGIIAKVPLLIMAVPIEKNGEVIGALYGSLEETAIREILSNQLFDEHSYSFVCDAQGKIIIASESGEFLPSKLDDNSAQEFALLDALSSEEKVDSKVLEDLSNDLANGRGNVLNYTLDGESRSAAYVPLSLPGVDWYLFTVVPKFVAEEYAMAGMRDNTWIIGTMIVFCLLTIGYTTIRENARRRALQEQTDDLIRNQALMRDNERLLRLRSENDSLTSIYNRAAFIAKFGELINSDTIPSREHSFDEENHTLTPRCHALLILDVDDFKDINDTCGHMVGDNVLVNTANRTRGMLREHDLVGRLGGDEFMLCIYDIHDEDVLAKRILSLSKRISEPFDNGPSITVSIGAALYPRDGDTFALLYERADFALYQAKSAGKGQMMIYNPAALES